MTHLPSRLLSGVLMASVPRNFLPKDRPQGRHHLPVPSPRDGRAVHRPGICPVCKAESRSSRKGDSRLSPRRPCRAQKTWRGDWLPRQEWAPAPGGVQAEPTGALPGMLQGMWGSLRGHSAAPLLPYSPRTPSTWDSVRLACGLKPTGDFSIRPAGRSRSGPGREGQWGC